MPLSEFYCPVTQCSVHHFIGRRLAVEFVTRPEDQARGAGIDHSPLKLCDEGVDLRIAGKLPIHDPLNQRNESLALSHVPSIASPGKRATLPESGRCVWSNVRPWGVALRYVA
jgi:hypothetical protein